jgi:hypothetical protein
MWYIIANVEHICEDIYCTECYTSEEEMLIAKNFYFSTRIEGQKC